MKPLPVPHTDTNVWIGDSPPPLNDTPTIPDGQPKAGRVWPWILLFVGMMVGSGLCWHLGMKIRADHVTTVKR